MLTERTLHMDENHVITVRNTVDYTGTLEALKMQGELNPDGRFGDKNHECICIGMIPEEFWSFDPWLLQAKKAERKGDQAEYQYWLLKFYEVHPVFKSTHRQKYWSGS